ncbi:MAG: DNA/RNA non-specific endonuclease [Flavobacteriales bacterium]|nr:DNA/RNA non-specific endonuclease [Flavobacteriales bacterium]
MMNPKFRPSAFKLRWEESRDERKRVRNLVAQGKEQEAEPDVARSKAYNSRVTAKLRPPGPEAIQGNTNDLQGASFLPEGSQVRRAVGFVEVNDVRESTVGSGFLISPKLFITNWHVMRDVQAAQGAQVTFDREMGADGKPQRTTTYLFAPDQFALFSPQDELDYAVVAIGARNGGEATLEELRYCPLSDTPDRHVVGMNVNIIQHPNGFPKMLSLRNNLLTARGKEGRTLLYESDTEQGSSGSPVFNDLWDVVALHHWGEPFLDKKDEDGKDIAVNLNEGVRISAIHAHLTARLAQLPPTQRALLQEALDLGNAPATTFPVFSLPRPRSGRPESVALSNDRTPSPTPTPMNDTNEVRMTIPLEVTVRVGAPTTASGSSNGANARASGTPALTRGAEAKKLDKDYTNRTGYNEDHIPGQTIPLPKPKKNGPVDGQVAALRGSEPNPDKGELTYEHFSVVMHKTRRMALFTATNIDGASYLSVDRDTGLARPGAEGETWYKDPRISESFWTGQDFYSAWSTYFDRGHLTRRTDPTWGNATTAERANADTFHFTNCSPQHFRFNQTTQYWQGAERYVLENGLMKADQAKPITVFQGPIFDDTIDLYADDLQIPSSFFKIIVWKSTSGLKAVGLVVDQLQLLAEPRTNLGQPREVANVNVNQWRVSVATIEARTGLDFGKAVRDADTITATGQPRVGEAAIRITALADILGKKVLEPIPA